MLGAIQQTAGPQTRRSPISKDGTGAEGADVAVVVVGETPYAEMLGDRARPRARPRVTWPRSRTRRRPASRWWSSCFSGRPLIINDALEQADAFVAAWLPGTEGLGVADVLFGDYKPTGQAARSAGRESMAQIPINVGDASYDPLFPFGFGLTY